MTVRMGLAIWTRKKLQQRPPGESEAVQVQEEVWLRGGKLEGDLAETR